MKITKGDIIAIEWGPAEHQRAKGMAVIEHADAPGEWFLISQLDGRNYSGPVVVNYTTGEMELFDWEAEEMADTAYGESFNY